MTDDWRPPDPDQLPDALTGEAAGDMPTSDQPAGDQPAAGTPGARARRIELYLLRHADAGDPAVWRGADEDRPLSGRGRKQSKRLGGLLADAGFRPDAILTSPKLRSVETAKLLAKPLKVKVQTNARLASDVSLGELEQVLETVPDARRVVVVGHDPDFSELLSLLTGGQLEMAKGALARVDVERPLRPDSGDLRWLVPPDVLKD